MGDRFEGQQVTAYQRIVKDYPLSIHAEDAKAQLEVMKRTVPEADPVAVARMKYEIENRTKQGMMGRTLRHLQLAAGYEPRRQSGSALDGRLPADDSGQRTAYRREQSAGRQQRSQHHPAGRR